jgi:hypothetical protein
MPAWKIFMKPRCMLRTQLRALTPVLLASMIAAFPRLSLSQQAPGSNATPYRGIRDALHALGSTKDKAEQERIYHNFNRIPVRDHDDLMALYKEARSRQDSAPLISTEKSFTDYVDHANIVSARLKDLTDPAFHDDIASLIDQETNSLSKTPGIPSLPLGKIEIGAGARSAVRVVRIHSLIDAAGDGKNEKARPALWRMVDTVQDAYFGQLAVVALGKIGNSADLERLIQMIKKDPNLRFQFDDFGSMAIPRLLQEIRNSALPQATQASLSGHLVQVANHGSLATFIPLLHDPNKIVASAALDAMGKSLTSGDDELIKQMLKDPDLKIHMMALNTIDGHAWDEKFIPVLVGQMQSGSDAAVRCLGHHNVKSVIPQLREAEVHSPNVYVRQAAHDVLSDMSEK